MAVVIAVRELAVTGLRGIASQHGMVLAADELGKYKMIFQMFALQALLLHYEYPIPGTGQVRGLALSPDGKHLAIARGAAKVDAMNVVDLENALHDPDWIEIRDVATWNVLETMHPKQGFVVELAFAVLLAK